MLIPYQCCVKKFEDYYTGQAGNGLAYYSGHSFQKGYGIGGWFKRLFRSALPFLTSSAKSVGKEVLRTGTQIASDVLEGRNLEESTRERARSTGKKLAKRAIERMDDMLGKGKRYKRKRKSPKLISSSKARKVKVRDIFDS